ncbi:MAG: HAD-IC family P-type ATPase [Endozoicomonas sp.]|uniref:HAD-IC family P-type ATPase n=1 Tax=Endozoicomonas sp. TaxID=1892382 RepID=UPI003D9BDDCB
MLVIASIPVAMPAVLSVTMALGALLLSKKKAIVSHLQAIEELASVDILCSDKAGTLTQNKLTFGEPVLYAAETPEVLNLTAAMASSPDGKDAIDSLICSSISDELMHGFEQLDFVPFDPVSKRSEASIKEGESHYRVSKGAPQVIIDLCKDSNEIRQDALDHVRRMAEKGLRTLGVARTDENGHFQLAGLLTLFDPPREDSKEVITQARAYGLEVKVVTGDDLAIGREISHQLGLGTELLAADDLFDEQTDMEHLPDSVRNTIVGAEGFARVFPEHKYGIVKNLQKSGFVVAMTGDGVNDAPALKQADVGIAVSGATDAARAAADLILTLPGLSVIIQAVEEARCIGISKHR